MNRLGKKRERILDRTRNCHYCKVNLNHTNSTVDHVIPKSKGGTDNIRNLVLCCIPCNQAKGTKTAGEYFAELAKQGKIQQEKKYIYPPYMLEP